MRTPVLLITAHLRLPRLLVVSAWWLLAAMPLTAVAASDTGNVAGRVTDSVTQLALAGAHVMLDRAGSETYTDSAGFYSLTEVATGRQTLRVNYLGYPDLTEEIMVEAGQSTRADLMFGKDTLALDRFVITGSLVGSARAINRQRAANTLTNIVAADEIGRFPDQNAAESIQRIPGASLYRDQGEGRFIVLRGIRPDLTGVSLNGVSVPSPDRGARTMPLDVIPSDALGAVEITKVPTPDLPADGVGGYVNLKTRSPFDAEQRQVQLSAQGQYNDLRDRLSSKYNGTYSDIFSDGKLGVIISPTWQARRFGSDNFEVSNPWILRTVPGTTTGQQVFFNQDINYREYEITRTRYGGNGAIEFKPEPGSLYYLRATYSHFVDRENRFVTTIPFSEGTLTALTDQSATIRGVRRENKQLRVREKAQDLYALSSGVEKTLGDWLVNAHAAYSEGTEDRVEDSAIFRKSARGSDWSYDFTPGIFSPVVTQTAGPAISDPAVFNEFNRLRSAPATGRESEGQAGADLRRDFALDRARSAFAKFGVLVRAKTKKQDREQVNYQPPATFTFAALAEPQSPDDYAFFTGPRISATTFNTTFVDRKGSYVAVRDIAASTQEDWKSNEDIYAAYGMGGATFGALNLSAGLRFERTEFTATGNTLRVTGSDLTITPASRTRGYNNYLPGAYLRYNLSERTIVRASWSNSLARPSFSENALMRSVNDDAQTVSESNPGLKALESINWDASIEHYFSSLGVVSAAVFRKDLKNFSYRSAAPGTIDPETGYALTTFVNGPKGHISGLELAYQQQFTFLPTPFNGLGFFANYTLTQSEASYLRTASNSFENAPFIGQSKRIGNVALSYEKYGVFVRLAFNFRSPRLREDEVLGATAAEDIYVDSFKQLDLTATYRVGRNWELFGEVLNLTNEPFRVTVGQERTRFRQFEEYGWSANFGVRWKL